MKLITKNISLYNEYEKLNCIGGALHFFASVFLKSLGLLFFIFISQKNEAQPLTRGQCEENFFNVGSHIQMIQPQLSLSKANNQLKIASETDDRQAQVIALIDLAWSYYFLQNDSLSQKFLENAHAKNKTLNDSIRIYNKINICALYAKLNNDSLFWKYFHDAEIYYSGMQKFYHISEVYSIAGDLLFEKSDFGNAMKYYLKSLQVKDEHQYNNTSTLLRLGDVMVGTHDYPKALEYYNNALKQHTSNADTICIAHALNAIGAVYDQTGRYTEALSFYNKSLGLLNNYDIATYKAELLKNIGHIYIQLNKNSKALENLRHALQYANQTENNKLISHILLHIGKVYSKKQKYSEALFYLNKGINMSWSVKALDNIRDGYLYISDLYLLQENHKRALTYYKLYTELKDSIFNLEKSKQLNDLQTKYETNKQQEQIKELQIQQESQVDKLLKRRNYLILALGLVAVLILFSVVLFKYYQFKHTVLEERNAKIERQNLELHTLNKTKDKLFSIISHDLKNPLGTLAHFLEEYAVEEKIIEGYHSKEILQMLADSAVQSINLLENLMQWAKTRDGELQPELSNFLLWDVVNDNIKLLAGNARKKMIELRNDVNQTSELYSDRQIITMVLRNLISNAIKFTHDGGRITVSAFLTSEKMEIIVEDNGTGMTPEEMENLFVEGRYYTTPGTHKEKGTGLGLMICKEFVDKLHGNIQVESKKNVGSRFTLVLPG